MENTRVPSDIETQQFNAFKKYRAFITLVSFFFICLACITLYQTFLVEKQKNLLSEKNIELEDLRTTISKLSNTEPVPDLPEEYISDYKCLAPYGDVIYSDDKLYYVGTDFSDRSIRICNTKSQQGPGEQTGKSQNGKNILFSYHSNDGTENVLFVLNTKLKTLKYYTKADLKDKDGSIVFIAPDEMTYDAWSPDNKKVIISTSPCWGCDPGDRVYFYVFNVEKETFTPLGNGARDIVWVDGNTISWTTYIFRDRTEADGGDAYSYGFVWEKGDSHKIVLD